MCSLPLPSNIDIEIYTSKSTVAIRLRFCPNIGISRDKAHFQQCTLGNIHLLPLESLRTSYAHVWKRYRGIADNQMRKSDFDVTPTRTLQLEVR